MRIIFLNVWKGRLQKKILDFVRKEKTKTEMFALCEVTENLNNLLIGELFDYNNYFALDKSLYNATDAQSIFVKKDLKVKSYDQLLLYTSRDEKEVPGYIQKLVIETLKGEYSIGNLQGKAFPGDKNDNPERLRQADNILKFMGNNPKTIFGGDFNLNPNTQSISKFEKAGFRNLIKEFDVRTTRNELAWKSARKDNVDKGWEIFGTQYFADYCFVTSDIKIKSFEVPDIVVSDHLPLILEIEI